MSDMFTGGRRRTGRAVLAAIAIVLARPAIGHSQGATDLYLVHLRAEGLRVAVDSVTRLTNRRGYDNQPHIVGGRTVLYTSIDDGGQADIMRLDLTTGAITNLTDTTPESEYSATLMPSGDRFSVIRVEADSAQRLWSFRLDGSDPRVLLEELMPIGYQAWIDEDRIGVFVLGNPATLQVANVRTGSARVIASNIGRSLNTVPGRRGISFVHREPGSPAWIKVFDPDAATLTPLIEALPGNEYHVWAPDGTLLSAEGSLLYQWLPGRDEAWVRIADLSDAGLTGISRMALSDDGRILVLVANH